MTIRQTRQAILSDLSSNSPNAGRIGIILKECSMRLPSKQVEAIEAEAVTPKADAAITSKDEEAQKRAAHRVYERYGTDLAAFRRDVEREVTAQNEAAQENDRS